VVHTLVALIALATFAFAASACTAYKAREADRNEGGGSSMYRATDSARTH
jgi:hypothetical protein